MTQLSPDDLVTPECIVGLIEKPITFPLCAIVYENGIAKCGCGDPTCGAVGKHPLVLYRALEHPGVPLGDCEGWGIKTGSAPDGSDIIALDADDAAAIAWIRERNGGPPQTTTIRTGRGEQYWYQAPAFRVRSSSNELAPKVDIKGFGSLTVGPGSPHKSGKRYELALAVPPAPCPEWLLAWDGLRSKQSDNAPTAYAGEVTGATLAYHKQIYINDLRKAPPATQGERDVKLWPLVQRGALDLRLPTDVIIECLREHYEPKVTPPWGPELERKVRYKADWARSKSNRPPREPRTRLRARAGKVEGTEANEVPERPRIKMGSDLDRVVAEAVDSLGLDPELFKRAGELVRVVRIDSVLSDKAHPEGTPQICTLPTATLKVRLTSTAEWYRLVLDRKTKDWDEVPCIPSDDVVSAIAQLKDWPDVPKLVGIVETPVLRPDGSVLQEPGYDEATGFYFDPCGAVFPAIDDAPDQTAAKAALETLTEAFQDFPYASDAAGVVPIAALLTMLARPAIDGNVPAFVIDAATRGSGKTKIADVVSLIATGRLIGKATFPSSEEELEKVLSGYARRGAAVFAFDNVGAEQELGGAPLDKVLTCGGSCDLRILGMNLQPTFDWRAIIFATGNNIAYRGDTPRRCLVCRLESPLENPEHRNDFLHPDLQGWVKQKRGELVTAGLTILRSFIAAGRPTLGDPWGSFEDWSMLVPPAIRWAGGADVLEARPVEAEDVSPEKTLLYRLIEAFPKGEWAVKELIAKSEERDPKAKGLGLLYPALREVLEDVCPSTEKGDRCKKIAKLFSRWRGRVIDQRRLMSRKEGKTKTLLWGISIPLE